MRSFLLVIISIFVAALFSISVYSQIPVTLNYQGLLTDKQGKPVDDNTYSITVKIYNTAAGGTALYSETIDNVTTTGGFINLLIGKSNPLNLPFDVVYWLGITVGNGTEFAPRSELSSVPYSLNSKISQSLAPNATGAVKNINGADGAVTLIGGTNVTIIKNGQNLTISSTGGSGTGIQGVQNTDGNLTITNPGGPTATINTSSSLNVKLNGWNLTGNSETDPAMNYIGTSDNKDLVFRTNNLERIRLSGDGTAITGNPDNSIDLGSASKSFRDIYISGNFLLKDTVFLCNPGTNNTLIGYTQNTTITGRWNTFVGYQCGQSNTSGTGNTAIGNEALWNNTTGYENTASGNQALSKNTTGTGNTAYGTSALWFNTTGNENTANGLDALTSNSTGSDNTANGSNALFSNTTGYSNVAIGIDALYSNINIHNLVAIGDSALYNNGTGAVNIGEAMYNTAVGSKALFSNTRGYQNTATGYLALFYNTTGFSNIANGSFALTNNTTGSDNTANGTGALMVNTTGSGNTANGSSALMNNSTGSYNSANGYEALPNNTTGYSNVAMGVKALFRNTDRGNLVAIGDSALYNNGTGALNIGEAVYNTAVGSKALFSNTRGYNNTANGYQTLWMNTNGNDNTANGYQSLWKNSIGTNNTANGSYTLYYNITGIENTACGISALFNNTTGNDNTAMGSNALVSNKTGINNSAFGAYAGPSNISLTNTTAIGYSAVPTASNMVRVGNTSVTSINGAVGFTVVSDGRFKKNVTEDVKGLEFIMNLRPVTYNYDAFGLAEFYKEDYRRDNKGNLAKMQANDVIQQSRTQKSAIRYSGFIAQEVEATAKKIGYDFSGIDAPQNENSLYGLRYAEFVVPLVKAIQEQQSLIDQLTKRIEALEKK